MIIDVF